MAQRQSPSPDALEQAVLDPIIMEHLKHVKEHLNGYLPKEENRDVYFQALKDTIVGANFSLPQHAGAVARLYTSLFEIPYEPLDEFLSTLANNERLEAVALAAWEIPSLSHNLSIYALLDRSREYKENTSEFSGAVDDAYGVFLDSLDDAGAKLESDLLFVNTRGQRLAPILRYLPQKLADEELMGVSMVTGSLRLLSIASVSHVAEHAA